MPTYVTWTMPNITWGADYFTWGNAIINEVKGALGDWSTPREWENVARKIPPQLAEKFLEVIVKVNGLSHSFKKNKNEKPKISVHHIQKTLREFGNPVKVKVEVKK